MNGVALYAALVAFGVLVGAVAGLLGIGGGLLMVPFLTIVAGATQHQAEATSLLVILPTAIVATVTLRRKGIGDAGLALRFGTVGAVGGIAGALVALTLPAHVLRLIFALFLAVMSVRMLRDGLTTKPEEEASNA
jgi:uncharacterized membrane protein YfcA